MRDSGFGEGYLDLELVLGLFAIAAAVAIWLDRPEREQRSVAELLALPARARRRPRGAARSPRSPATPARRRRAGCRSRSTGSTSPPASVWIGGLIGLLVFWLSVAAPAAPPRSRTSSRASPSSPSCSVLLLIGTGIGKSLFQLPTLRLALGDVVREGADLKIGVLAVALLVASVNLARTKPRLAGRRRLARRLLLRRLVQGEIVFVAAALFAAGVLASLAPPSSALARVQDVAARVGPGAVSRGRSRRAPTGSTCG